MPGQKHRRRKEPTIRAHSGKSVRHRKQSSRKKSAVRDRSRKSVVRHRQEGKSARLRREPTIRVRSENPMLPGQVGQPDRVKKIVFKQLGPYLRTLTEVMHMDPKKNEEKIRKKLLDLGKPRKVNGKPQFHEDDIGSSMEISVLLG